MIQLNDDTIQNDLGFKRLKHFQNMGEYMDNENIALNTYYKDPTGRFVLSKNGYSNLGENAYTLHIDDLDFRSIGCLDVEYVETVKQIMNAYKYIEQI